MSEPLKVLIVEDSENDALLVLRALRRAGFVPEHRRVETREALVQALDEVLWDVVISDYTLPTLDAPRALEAVQASGQDLPFIVVSGTVGEDVAVDTMRHGAHDYLLKGQLTRLGEAIRREQREAVHRAARHHAERKTRHLVRVLRGIRNVNQLIVREKDPERLIRQACELTVEARGFALCCIVLVEHDRVKLMVDAGSPESLHGLRQLLGQGTIPDCMQRILQGPGLESRPARSERCAECSACDARLTLADDMVAVRLQHAGTVYGAMLVALPAGLGQDEEERGLLEEVAGDIAFGLYGIERDAAHARAVDAVHHSAERWRATFDAISDIVCVLTPEHEILAINRAGARAAGSSPEELAGRKCYEIVHGSHVPIAECPCAEAARSLAPAQRLYTEQDRTFELSAWPMLDAAGRLEALVHVVKDVTALHEIQAALERSERQYRALVENLDDVVFDLDERGRFRFVSSAVQHFGYAPGELVGRHFRTVVHPEDLQGLMQSFQRTLAGAEEPYEFRALDTQGGEHFVRSSSRAVREPGEPLHVAGVLIDLTEQHELLQQLQLSQKMEAVGRLAGGIAHDFNNLLTVINSYAELSLPALDECEPVRENLTEIKAAGERAAQLTGQLLAFSRKQILQPEALEVNEGVRSLEAMLRRILGEDIDLVVALAEDAGYVEADPGQLQQVLMNLVVNARDAMPKGGKLTIETTAVHLDGAYAERHIAVTPGPYVCLAVSDNGHGMGRDTREHIFEPFFTTKAKGEGTGLGLSTVYGIVKQSGGNIWVYSEPGQGTTFKIYLPRISAPAPKPRRPVTTGVPTGTETVLVVEDEDGVRRIIERILSQAGYTVVAAASGAEALARCAELDGPLHLVLTDVVMPEMSGKEFAERLAVQHPDVRILYMSGYTDNAIVHHGVLDAGTAFIGKPFAPDELARKIREVLDQD